MSSNFLTTINGDLINPSEIVRVESHTNPKYPDKPAMRIRTAVLRDGTVHELHFAEQGKLLATTLVPAGPNDKAVIVLLDKDNNPYTIEIKIVAWDIGFDSDGDVRGVYPVLAGDIYSGNAGIVQPDGKISVAGDCCGLTLDGYMEQYAPDPIIN